jgi:hypothetical protein
MFYLIVVSSCGIIFDRCVEKKYIEYHNIEYRRSIIMFLMFYLIGVSSCGIIFDWRLSRKVYFHGVFQMNKKLPFIFFSLVLSQTVVWNSSIMIYQLNYFTWDYNEDKLFFYSNDIEHRCEMVTRKCLPSNTDYIPTTYISTSNYYFINDILNERT